MDFLCPLPEEHLWLAIFQAGCPARQGSGVGDQKGNPQTAGFGRRGGRAEPDKKKQRPGERNREGVRIPNCRDEAGIPPQAQHQVNQTNANCEPNGLAAKPTEPIS